MVWPDCVFAIAVAPYLRDAATSDATQKLVTSGFDDLSGALRQRLGRSFALVVPIGFPIVTGLAIAYLCFLGPLDYLVIHRWLRRPRLAWITFPIIVAAFSIVALAVGNWSRGTSGAAGQPARTYRFRFDYGPGTGHFLGHRL